MTCVAAIEYWNRVYFCSDAFVGSDVSRDILARPKVFRRTHPPLVFAFASGIRGAQLVENYTVFREREPKESVEAYMVKAIADSIKATYKAHDHTSDDTVYLCAHAGHLYLIQADLSVLRSAHGYAAIGAGSDMALGALGALQEAVTSRAITPKAALDKALTLASRHCSMVTPPFTHTRA